MDTGISTGTSRQEETPQSTPKVDLSQKTNPSQRTSLASSTIDLSQNANPTLSSPFTPDKDEKVVKVEDFNSFLQYFQKKYVSSWTRANTGFVCIILQSSLNQNNLVSNCSPKQIGPNSRRSEENVNTTGRS